MLMDSLLNDLDGFIGWIFTTGGLITVGVIVFFILLKKKNDEDEEKKDAERERRKKYYQKKKENTTVITETKITKIQNAKNKTIKEE